MIDRLTQSRMDPRASCPRGEWWVVVTVLLVANAGIPGSAGGAAIPSPTDAPQELTDETRHPVATGGSVTVEGTTVGNVFIAEETPTFELRGDADEVRWHVRDYWGERIAGGRKSLQGNSTALEVDPGTTGYFELVVGPVDGTQANETRTAFAVVPPERYATGDSFEAVEESFFGLQGHYSKAYPLESIPLLRMTGAKHVRDGIMWHTIEHEEGVYEYTEKQRNMMASFDRNDLAPLIGMWYGNTLYYEAAPGDRWPPHFSVPQTPEARQAYANYGRELVTHYDDQLEYVEFWNEYNHMRRGLPDDGEAIENYVELTDVTYDEVKSARSDVTVVGGSIAGFGEMPPKQWLRELGETGSLENMDAVSIHPYRKGLSPEAPGTDRGSMHSEMQEYQNITAEYNDGEPMPLWITETGWPAHERRTIVGERGQGQFIPRAYTMTKAAGVQRYFYYQFQSSGEKGSGIVRAPDNRLGPAHPMGGLTPHPSYVTYSVVTRQLTGASFEEREPVEGAYSYRFDRQGTPLRVLWSLNQTDVTVETDDSLTVTNVMGESRTLSPSDGTVELTLSEDPLYVAGSATAVTAGTRANVTASDTAQGERIPVAVSYDNSDGTSSQSVTFTAGDRETTVDVAAGERASETLRVPGRQRLGDRVVNVRVTVDGEETALLRDVASVTEALTADVAPNVDGEGLSRTAALDVTLRSQTARQETTLETIRWTVGEHSGQRAVEQAVPAGSEQTVRVPLREIGDWEHYRPYTANLTLEFADRGAVEVSETFTPFSPALARTPEVDGDVGESRGLPAADLPAEGTVVIDDADYDGSSDLGGTVRLLWDDEHLYFQAAVTDDEHVQPAEEAGNSWKGDGVQLAIAPGRPGAASTFSVYTFALNAEGEPVLQGVDSPSSTANDPEGADLAIVRNDDAARTTYELAVPWSEITGFDGPPEDTFSASLVINDNDGDGRKGWVEWGSGIARSRKSALFRPIVPVDAAGTPSTVTDIPGTPTVTTTETPRKSVPDAEEVATTVAGGETMTTSAGGDTTQTTSADGDRTATTSPGDVTPTGAPGFGVLAVVLALLAAAMVLVRRE
jgi:PGF-CTERM protein